MLRVFKSIHITRRSGFMLGTGGPGLRHLHAPRNFGMMSNQNYKRVLGAVCFTAVNEVVGVSTTDACNCKSIITPLLKASIAI